MHQTHLSTIRRLSQSPSSLGALATAVALTFLGMGAAMPEPAEAQSGYRGATQTRGSAGYRTQGRYRGATQARPQAVPFLQPGGLSGIRPNGLGKFQGGVVGPSTYVQPPAVVAPGPRVIYVPVGNYFPQAAPEPVIIVQQQPPQPQQPVVVMVPPSTPATPAPAVAPPRAPEPRRPALPPTPKEPGLLTISILPAEAEAYLDDRRLDDLGNEPRSLDAGVHILEISHPDYPNERLVFGMGSAGNVEIEIDLRETKSGRRTRLREASP